MRGGVAGVAAMAVSTPLASCSGERPSVQQPPVVGSYDVVVCGGGPAGVMAALAAARQKMKVALVERYGFLGGMATMGYVMPISEFTFSGRLVIGGIPWEFIKRLESMGGAYIETPKGNVDFDVELYKLCMQRMVLEAGVDLYMHSYMTGCTMDGNRLQQIIIHNKNGAEAIEGKTFVDATGDADLAHMAHVPMQPDADGERQPLSFCFILSGVKTDSDMMMRCMYHDGRSGPSQCLPVREKLLKMKEEGADLPDFGGPWFNNVMHKGSVAVNMTRLAADACDNRGFMQAECRLREDIFKFVRILRENFEDFKHCYVSSTAPQAGIRESRRILGVHTVSAEEYLGGYRYEDSVSRGAHPIDIHSSKGAGQVRSDLKQAAYVPYRCMIAQDYPNLLVAGRCVSADRHALASLRVQASCMGMGQAAGAAAAQSVRTGRDVQGIDTAELVSTLKKWGAVI